MSSPEHERSARPLRADETALVETMVAGRRSIRAFLTTPVAPSLVEHILDVSARAPSGTNMQPWRAYVLGGETKAALEQALAAEHEREPGLGRVSEYEYYPSPFFEPYLARRRKVGYDMYGVLGIGRDDKAAMHAQHGRNLVFFGAPIGLIFTLHRGLKIGSWLDYGMFLQNIMITARAHGLDTCPQAAFAPFHATIRQHVPLGEHEMVVCGMALGYEDTDARVNSLRTERVPARDFTTFLGFD